jgi:hypothetical protein
MALKKVSKKKVNNINRKDKFDLFLKSLTEFYEGDSNAPGVQVAWLGDKQCWYAAVHRYQVGHGSTRQVVTSCKSSASRGSALDILMKQWKEIVVSKQKNNLKEFLGV